MKMSNIILSATCAKKSPNLIARVEQDKTRAEALLLMLRNHYGGSRQLAKAIGAAKSQVAKWCTKVNGIPASYAIKLARLMAAEEASAQVEARLEIYRLVRTLVSQRIPADLEHYDDTMQSDYQNMVKEGVRVNKTYLSRLTFPDTRITDFPLTATGLTNDLQLPLLVDKAGVMLQSPRLVEAIKALACSEVALRWVDIERCLKEDAPFPYCMAYSLSTRCRVAAVIQAGVVDGKLSLPKTQGDTPCITQKYASMESHLARVVGLGERYFYRLLQLIFQHGIEEVIDWVEERRLLIGIASKTVLLPQKAQYAKLTQKRIMPNQSLSHHSKNNH